MLEELKTKIHLTFHHVEKLLILILLINYIHYIIQLFYKIEQLNYTCILHCREEKYFIIK